MRRLLTAGGDDVFTPPLTGTGERSHLATPDVGLETPITDVLRHDSAWRVTALDGGHDIMADKPRDLADVLLRAV